MKKLILIVGLVFFGLQAQAIDISGDWCLKAESVTLKALSIDSEGNFVEYAIKSTKGDLYRQYSGQFSFGVSNHYMIYDGLGEVGLSEVTKSTRLFGQKKLTLHYSDGSSDIFNSCKLKAAN